MTGIEIDPRLCILLSVVLFLVPLPWVCAWIAAVCFHEFCHWSTVKLLGGNICRFSVGLGGANMVCADLPPIAYFVSILAGPMGGFVLALFGRCFPRIAICSWLLSAYNLLPVLPLDGGRAMHILIKNSTTFLFIEKTVLFCVSLLATIAVVFMKLGPLPLAVVASVWIKYRKRPCKETLCGVQ